MAQSTQKICFIYCYFGHWPWYFKFFLKSCSYNLDIDFIILTDNKKLDYEYNNVKLMQSSLKEINKLATEKFGFQTNLTTPYKLCDFKPAYGFLFDDILKEYDFWGHGDIDVVFGKIRDFITIELLEEYDVISVRNDYPSGFFMLYRNTAVANILFKRSKDCQKVFSSDIHYCFDECNFQYDQIKHGLSIFETKAEIESMMHVIKRADEENKINAFFDFFVIEGQPGELKWKKGTLSYKNEFEVLLYHFITIKTNDYFQAPKWSSIPDTFYIEKTTFFRFSEKSFKGFFLHLLENGRVRCQKFKHLILIKLSHLFNPIMSRRRLDRLYPIWKGTYILEPYTANISFDDNSYFLDFGTKGKHLVRLIPLFRSAGTFSASGSHMIIKFEKQRNLKKMIIRYSNGNIQKYSCRADIRKSSPVTNTT